MVSDAVLTVGELREELEDLPDDAPVAYEAGGIFEYIEEVELMQPLKVSRDTAALKPSDD